VINVVRYICKGKVVLELKNGFGTRKELQSAQQYQLCVIGHVNLG
jgi:hypothetical protein